MYINHINKYADAQAIQDALDAGSLLNPYVAMTSAGTLDYNSLQPTPPIYVQDSSGNQYFPTEASPGIFNFNFTMDIADMWTLYDGGSIAMASVDWQLNQYCNGELVGTEGQYQEDTPQQLKDFNFGGVSYDNPDGTVIISYQKYPNYNFASIEMRYTYCGGGSTSSS